MPTYKLTYFNARARGESARLMFKLAGVEFEDRRIQPNDWPELKPKTLFGTLPILTVDGKHELTQTKAIGRYLARELGFYGETNLQCAEIDCVMDMGEDVYEGAKAVFFAQGDDAKAVAVAEYKKGVVNVLANLEKKLRQNNDGTGFFVGTKMTVADIFAYCGLDVVCTVSGDKDILKDYPRLSVFKNRISRNEKIAAWEARPETPL